MKTHSVSGLCIAAAAVTLVACTSLLGDFKSPTSSDASTVGGGDASTDVGSSGEGSVGLSNDGSDAPGNGTCPAGQVSCDAVCVPSDTMNCGTCGHDCTNLPNVAGTVSCTTAGACSFDSTACAPGYADCDGNADNGCEANLGLPATCGSCTTSCTGATPTCVQNGDAGPFGCASSCVTQCGGQCTDTTSDVKNCGTCGNACPGDANGQAACVASKCSLTCSAGYHVCGSACAANTSPSTCGALCTACTVPTGATATCDGTNCGFTCNAGSHLCAGACATSTSPSTCGTSCTACAPTENATATCDGTNCGFTCNAGFHDCAGACASNTSPATCGASCNACAVPVDATGTCDGTNCGFACNAGYSLCSGVCISATDEQSDDSNCGSCGKTCTSGVACTTGKCIVRDGYTTPYSGVANNSGNYIFGMLVTVPYPITVTAVAAITIATGGVFAMGLYTDVGTGLPGTLIVGTGAVTGTSSAQELAVTPTAIAAGSYWVCASASAAGVDHWGYEAANSDFAGAYTYTGTMPATAPSGSIYSGDTLNFYLVGYE